MATGGDFDYNERDPLMAHTDDQDNADEGNLAAGGNETTGFEPGASSTPATNGNQRQTTMNRPGEQPSYVELPVAPGLSTTNFAESELLKEFPFFDKCKIKYKLDDNGRLKVGINRTKKPYYHLITKIPGKEEYRINKDLKKEIELALGKPRRKTLEEKIKKLTDDINDNKAVAGDSSADKTERNKARERAKMQINERTALTRELDQLKKGKYYQPSESTELEEFQTNDEVRREIDQEIQREIEEQQEITNDKNRPSAERERAKEKLKELEQKKNEIENDREREIEQLPLRDRLRERVKAIFKKHGFTVTAVLLAVGTTLGVLLSSPSNGLKEVANGVGNGLKTLAKKKADILPGLLGAVVSFVFRTAGQVISFLEKHAWLLILAVAAFLFERVMKRRD